VDVRSEARGQQQDVKSPQGILWLTSVNQIQSVRQTGIARTA